MIEWVNVGTEFDEDISPDRVHEWFTDEFETVHIGRKFAGHIVVTLPDAQRETAKQFLIDHCDDFTHGIIVNVDEKTGLASAVAYDISADGVSKAFAKPADPDVRLINWSVYHRGITVDGTYHG